MVERSLFIWDISLNLKRSTFDELREGFSDIAAGCRWGLKVVKAILVGIVFDDLRTHLSWLGQIWLVADEHDGDPGFCVFLEFAKPLLYVLESFGFGEVEGNNGSNSASVVCVGDGSEAFLSGGVPDLIFDAFAVDVGGFGGELNSDGGLGVHVEDVVDESRKKVRLTHAWVADHHYLEEEVELLLSGHSEFITHMQQHNTIS